MTIDPQLAVYGLASYGTLAPGKPNARQLEALQGEWVKGTVRGHLVERGWGAAMGFPAIILDASGSEIDVDLFRSLELPAHWDRLDAFEGDEYTRVQVQVSTANGPVQAFIYVAGSPAQR